MFGKYGTLGKNNPRVILQFLEEMRGASGSNVLRQCCERISELFRDLQSRAIEQNRWESADRYRKISQIYGPDWNGHLFSSYGAIAATIAALASTGSATRSFKSADASLTHIYKEECVRFLTVLTTWKRSDWLHSQTAFSLDDTAQIEKRRVGNLDLRCMKIMYISSRPFGWKKSRCLLRIKPFCVCQGFWMALKLVAVYVTKTDPLRASY